MAPNKRERLRTVISVVVAVVVIVGVGWLLVQMLTTSIGQPAG